MHTDEPILLYSCETILYYGGVSLNFVNLCLLIGSLRNDFEKYVSSIEIKIIQSIRNQATWY